MIRIKNFLSVIVVMVAAAPCGLTLGCRLH
jgi:hypothetical protein